MKAIRRKFYHSLPHKVPHPLSSASLVKLSGSKNGVFKARKKPKVTSKRRLEVACCLGLLSIRLDQVLLLWILSYILPCHFYFTKYEVLFCSLGWEIGQVIFFEVHSGEAKCTLFPISWYYVTASLSYSFRKSYCSEDQPPECKLVSNINSELKLQVKNGDSGIFLSLSLTGNLFCSSWKVINLHCEKFYY